MRRSSLAKLYVIELHSKPVSKLMVNAGQELYFQLSVDQQNIGAKKLYLRLGFSVVELSSTHALCNENKLCNGNKLNSGNNSALQLLIFYHSRLLCGVIGCTSNFL